MTILYSKLARVYHEMYQSLFNYEKEYHFYHEYLQKYNCQSVLEIGCGTGNLAPYFLKDNYEYGGLDFYAEMLEIARQVEPAATFIQGDMRDIQLNQKFDAAIIPGRSFTYMTTNNDVMNALQSIHRTLKADGILIFDNFKAENIFLNFQNHHEHEVAVGQKKIKRVSNNSMNLQTGWTWNWNATYLIEEEGNLSEIIEDHSILRAFTEDELRIFLQLSNFKVLEVMNENMLVFIVKSGN